MNWKLFEIKYANRESWAFEQMSYLLFCAETGNRIGLFRFKNQAGIETEPFVIDGKYCGFQAKYYSLPITRNKKDIIDSIHKAKIKNPQLNVLFLYINQELSESSARTRKKPYAFEDIEQVAREAGIELRWRVPSHLELQLSLPENQYIKNLFFDPSPNFSDLPDEISRHNHLILNDIQTEIRFGETFIKVDRSNAIQRIAEALKCGENLIISGEGGCGKTAVFKEVFLQYSSKYPFCVVKAGELTVNNLNELFILSKRYSFQQFLDAFKDEPQKVFVIDSAEKIAEHSNLDIHKELIKQLKENGWTLLFTTRYVYLNDLAFHLKETFQMKFCVVDIPMLSQDELVAVCKEHDIILPDNLKFAERLRNLFYLKEFTRLYPETNKGSNYAEFIDLLWKKRIKGLIQKDNLHLERERCLLGIVGRRCETGLFYINMVGFPQQALFSLWQDEIISYDEDHDAYFITHDIYEEWALRRMVALYFNNAHSTAEFFKNIGNSLIIRRAFRIWLSEKIAERDETVIQFLLASCSNKNLDLHWKDEILVSILLSDYCSVFIDRLEDTLSDDESLLLKRAIFLLRIACTDLAVHNTSGAIVPRGKGWGVMIERLHTRWESFFRDNLSLTLPILEVWVNTNQDRDICRHAGLLALGAIQSQEFQDRFNLHKNDEEVLFQIVFKASAAIKNELKAVIDEVITHQETDQHSPSSRLCIKILVEPYQALDVIHLLPGSIIDLCLLFWQQPEENKSRLGFERESMECKFGVNDSYALDYFPASAHQTPVLWLLNRAPKETIHLITTFTDKAVSNYRKTDYGEKDLTTVALHIGHETIPQYFSSSLWNMYRGTSSPVIPSLLQSIHMALERYLLDLGKIIQAETLKDLLLDILKNTHSASITAVICSVVLAYPDKLYEVAKVLFNTIELFHADLFRWQNEYSAKQLYAIGYGLDKKKDILYADERLKTCEDGHRNRHLESLFLNYQYFGVAGLTEQQNNKFLKELYHIIDNYKADPAIKQSYGMLIARMDRRNLQVILSDRKNGTLEIEFQPKEIDAELKRKREITAKEYDDYFKYTSLRIWGDFITNTQNVEKSPAFESFDKSPLLALEKTKELVDELNNGRNTLNNLDYTIPPFVCSKLMVLYRDMLSPDDKQFCKAIIDATIHSLFSGHYQYQIGDGLEASIHAVPALIETFPGEDYITPLVLALLDETPIGNYKRICDYVTDSLAKAHLWDTAPQSAKAVLFGYLNAKQHYDKIVRDRVAGYKPRRLSPNEVISILKKKQIRSRFNPDSVTRIGICGMEKVLLLLPSNTQDRLHLSITQRMLPSLASTLSDNDHELDSRVSPSIDLHIFRWMARFLLFRNDEDLETYLNPFTNNIVLSRESSWFISELVFAEDELRMHDTFWRIWRALLAPISKLYCNNPRNNAPTELLTNYLLAWPWWKDGIHQWHSLTSSDLSFYDEVSIKMSSVPATLYSIAKVLNNIGYNFVSEGIQWLYNIMSTYPELVLGNLQSTTLYYLESMMRRYIYGNRFAIKIDSQLKNKVLIILSFMVERGSAHGYQLRESIL